MTTAMVDYWCHGARNLELSRLVPLETGLEVEQRHSAGLATENMMYVRVSAYSNLHIFYQTLSR